MKIEDVDAIGVQLLQALLKPLSQHFGPVLPSDSVLSMSWSSDGIDLCSDLQTTVFPSRLLGESFLLSVDISTSRIDFIVPSSLEMIKERLVFLEIGDSGPCFGLG
jgi:hypothetical protein